MKKTTKTKSFCRFRKYGEFSKRGSIEVSFNWIFILIAGAVIFAFFVNVIGKQKAISEVKTAGTIITNLDSILTGAQISTGTVNIVDLPRVDIGFECDRYFIGQTPKQTKSNVIFAPDLLKGKQLITWAVDWNLPYRVTNFLYLTDPQLRYVIVKDSGGLGLADKLSEELPKEMNKEVYDPDATAPANQFIDKNNYKVKFVFFDDPESDIKYNKNILDPIAYMPDSDVTAIFLDINTPTIPTIGEIKFYQKDGTTWSSEAATTYYIKKEALFGAIFASDIDMYNCVMKKAFKKLNLVTKVYINRSKELAEFYSGEACFDPHRTNNLEAMEDKSNSEASNFPQGPLTGMQNSISEIKAQNQQAQLLTCALVY